MVYQSIFYMVSWHMIFDCSCSWNIVASSWKVHAFFSFILKEKKTSISMVGHMQKSETFAELSQCQSVAPSLAPSSLSLPFCTRFSLSRIQYYLYISLPPLASSSPSPPSSSSAASSTSPSVVACTERRLSSWESREGGKDGEHLRRRREGSCGGGLQAIEPR
jgi:hypothetical protein